MIGHCLPPRLLPKALQDLRVQFQRVAAAAFTSKDLCRSAVIEIIHAKYMACTGVDYISWRSMGALPLEAVPVSKLEFGAITSLAFDVRFSNRPFGVKRFQTIHQFSVDAARGLVLLFGIGTKSLPSWDSKTRWTNLWGGLAVRRTVGPSGHTISPHPSSRE